MGAFTQTILTNGTITVSGSSTAFIGFGNNETSLVINITGPVTGSSPTITFTIQEVDPGNQTTTLGASKTGTTLTGVGTQILTIPNLTTGSIIISWVVTGSSPSFGGVYVTLSDKNNTPYIYDIAGNGPVAVKPASTAALATDPAFVVAVSPNNIVNVTGTVTATNPSVSTTGTTPPASATYIGGSVTTAAPTYTTGQMNALSLTTGGLLRIDGSAVTQPVSGTVTVTQSTAANLKAQTASESTTATSTGTVAGLVGGAVTTAAPTYTTGQMDPLSLTTAGALRIDGSGVTQPVSGTVAATQSGTWTVQPGNTANTTPWLATINQGGNSATVTASNALKIDGSAVTQPVSGTVTSNQGTANTLANAWSTKITDATNGPVAVKAASTAAVATDPALVVAVSPNNSVTVTQATATNLKAQTASEATTATSTGTVASLTGGAVTTAAPTYTTGQMDPLSLTTAGALRVDGSGVTQPVSGTVTSNQGTANTLTNGWPVKVTDGTNTMPTGDAVGRAIFHKITDGTNTAAVKAASTAAVVGDPALVVSVSPNTPITVGISQTDVTASGTLNALNATATIALAGTNGAGMQLAAGTLIGTIVPELSFDGGTTWTGTYFDDPTTDTKVSSIVFSSSNTATSRTIVGSGGASNIRVRVSAFTSGTATCNLRASTETDPSSLYSGAVGSATQPPSASQIAGFDGTFKVPAVKSASTTPVVGDQALVVVLSPNQQAIPVTTNPVTSVPNIAAGYVITSAVTNTAVIASTYVEQTTNAQRSFKSASANDTSAGTGARTILLTYYDSTLAGPFTETITMNGTAAVNTVSTTICYVESIIVATAGSTHSNVGIISMFTTTAGGGTTMATVNATENRTFWGNHYVATGKTCYITGLSGHNTNSSNGSVLTLTVFNPSSANQVESQISDFVRVGGGTSQPVRDYNQLIKVVGPNRVRLYEACEGTASITTRAAFDFYDQ